MLRGEISLVLLTARLFFAQNLPCLADAFKKADEELQEARQAVGKSYTGAMLRSSPADEPDATAFYH
jgi:hypothetical protein